MSAVGASTTGIDHPETEYSCATCLSNFDSRETQRAHMRDDWHVYNLKRRIASLSPISATIFHEQVLAFADDTGSDEAEASAPFEQSCIACSQHYTNRKAWQAHLKSRNHTQKSAEFNSKTSFVSENGPSSSTISSNSREEGQTPVEGERFSPLQCLFCNVETSSMDSNLTHMSLEHSFFIPDAEYVIDMESFLSYLFAIVSVFQECLFCGSSRSSKFAVQHHMLGKGHCKLDFEDEENQLWDFYDFSGDGDDDDEEEPEEEVTLVPDEDELRLPSGKTLGHRSRYRYFRQNLSKRPLHASSSQQLLTEAGSGTLPTESRDRRVATRPGTSTSMIGVPELRQRVLMAVERKMVKVETRARNNYERKVEIVGNRQKRFKVSGIGKKRGGLEKRLG